jgi:aconitate hydratase
VGGNNYGQGSSREHAALAPRFLGFLVVLARSFERIHWQKLVNFGILPLTLADAAEYDRLQPGDRLHLAGTWRLSLTVRKAVRTKHGGARLTAMR